MVEEQHIYCKVQLADSTKQYIEMLLDMESFQDIRSGFKLCIHPCINPGYVNSQDLVSRTNKYMLRLGISIMLKITTRDHTQQYCRVYEFISGKKTERRNSTSHTIHRDKATFTMAMENNKPQQTSMVCKSLKERNQISRLIQILDEALRIHDMVLESMGEIVETAPITSSWTQVTSGKRESRALCGKPG